MGGVGVWVAKVGGCLGSQNLLKNRRILVRTNVYLYSAHLFFLNAWPIINVVLNLQANTSNQHRPLRLDLVEPTRYPENLVSALGVDKRQEE